jgi:hypothetical protein
MTLNAPGSVVAGTAFQASYSFGRNKSGGAVAIVPGGPRSIYVTEVPCGSPGAGPKNKFGQCSPSGPEYFLQQLGAISSAPITSQSGTVSLVAPANPGQYGLLTIYAPDGGTLDTISLMVVAAPTAASAAASPPAPSPSVANPWAAAGAPVYTPPSPEPASSDGQRLSMQSADVQAFYVSGYGPGVLAATQFVVDHEHQLQAIGASHPAPDPCTTAPLISLEAWVNKYGGGVQPGANYAQVQVPDCTDGPARVGINTPMRLATPVTFPAGPGVGGPDTGLLGGGGGFSSGTPTVPDQRQTGAPPPSVGGLVAEVTANKPLLIGVAAVAAYMLFGSGGHRR